MVGGIYHSTFITAPCPLQKQQRALPHLTEPHDSLRLGVHTLKDRASTNHPVEAIEEQASSPADVISYTCMSGCHAKSWKGAGEA